MTYDEALAFIHGAYGLGEKRGLENMHRLLALLDNPHKKFRAVHVAGTNGKGSVCAFLQAALRCGGYRTGLYTSPFLQRYNERMRIDGVPIADDMLADITTRVARAVTALRAEDVRPTEFEIGTAVAFTYFAQAGIDIAVIEAGLGGRIDPTNVLTPLVSAIAAIGLDHMRVLGDTLEAIAGEKAGIIKPGVPLVLSSQNPTGVRSVVKARCEAQSAPYILSKPAGGLRLALPGAHQVDNAGVAVAVLRQLREMGFSGLTDTAIEEGLRRAQWPGRLEWQAGAPPFLLDGAHNEQGAVALATYVASLPPRRTVLLCGIMRDKQWMPMVKALSSVADAVITVAPDNHRALPAPQLAGAFRKLGIRAKAAGSVAEAIDRAKAEASAEGQVVVAGSLYLVGEARTALHFSDNTLLLPEGEG